MTSFELRARIEKVQDKIAKKQATIAKKSIWIQNANGKRSASEIHWLEEDVKRLGKEIAESEKSLAKYELQLSKEIERESAYASEIPDSMKQLETELTDRWTEYDIKHRDQMREDERKMDYRAFQAKYSGSMILSLLYENEETLRKRNERAAFMFVLDLYNRVKEITGEVTDWTGIRCAGSALNGLVVGKEGRAKVESILAGGYNIQRLHVRVLVHSF